jgi:hypothetical protein
MSDEEMPVLLTQSSQFERNSLLCEKDGSEEVLFAARMHSANEEGKGDAYS